MKYVITKIKESKKSTKVGVVTSGIIALILLIMVPLGAFNQKAPVPIEEVIEPFTSDVYVELINGKKDAKMQDVKFILDGKSELTDNKKKVIADTVLTMNKPMLMANLLEGKYVLSLSAAPIEADGSTYKLPAKQIGFEVLDIASENVPTTSNNEQTAKNSKEQTTKNTKETSGNNETTSNNVDTKTHNVIYNKDGSTTLQLKLERIDVKTMSKEQLHGVIARIEKEAPKKHVELVKTLNKQVATAESKPETADDVVVDTPNNPTPKPDAPAGSNKPTPETPSKPKPDTPNKPAPEKPTKPTPPAEKPKPPVEKPAEEVCTPNSQWHPAIPEQGYWETVPAVTRWVVQYTTGDGHTFNNVNDAEMHSILNETNYWNSSYEEVVSEAYDRWVVTAAAQPGWTEELPPTCVWV